ncbi:hypothetical protein ACO0LB_06860 [Undibacterium sp. SXout7W]|uniref:hypothetical protein n=1 Tax=Undibacterium sp. SXout7W TaxID=3413049 RepID=UPI003BF237FF
METIKNLANSIIEDVSAVMKGTIETSAQEAKNIAEKLEPIKDETIRMGRNGYHSMEDALILGTEQVKNAGGATVDAIKAVVKEPTIVVEATLDGVNKTKEAILQAKAFTADAYNRRAEIFDDTKTSVKESAEWTADKAIYIVKNPVETIGDIKEHSKAILKGTLDGATSFSGHFTAGKQDFEDCENRIKLQSAEHKELTDLPLITAGKLTNNSAFLDAILLGGDSLHAALASKIPNDILLAYQMTMPNIALEKSFKEYVLDLGSKASEDMFVSKIKGKLFEIQYVDYLNSYDRLPSGYHAEMAQLPNQPGWDIHIVGPDGVDIDYLQLKATDSIQYVREALERYPDIHVVTTSEVYSELVLRGYQERVTDSGIANIDLENLSTDGVGVANEGMGDPSLISLALIAFTSYNRSDLTSIDRSKLFGDRSGKYAISFYVGAAATAGYDSGAKIAAILIATVTQAILGSGQQKIDRLKAMEKLIYNNEVLLNKLRDQRRASH